MARFANKSNSSNGLFRGSPATDPWMDPLVQRGATPSSVTVPESSSISAETRLAGGLISGEHYMASLLIPGSNVFLLILPPTVLLRHWGACFASFCANTQSACASGHPMKGKYPLQNLCSNPILCLCSVEEFLCSTLMKWASSVMAERVGFEPTVPCEDNSF